MKTIWTSGLSKDKASELKADFIHSVYLRQRLSEILQNRIESARDAVVSSSRYESPSWAYIQADNIGYERGLREIISLLDSNSLKE